MRRAGESPSTSLRAGPRPHIQITRGLEQRCRPSLPGLSFFFGDVFHVAYVGACLGQDVMQVVADADEGESLFEELAHASGAEQEESKDKIIFARMVDE